MELEQLERKISVVQETQLHCFTDSWIQEFEMRKLIDQLAKRLAKLEKEVDQHQRLGDFCPHTDT